MHSPAAPINAATQLMHDVCRQLGDLDILDLPHDALASVRIIQLRRLARRIEALIPGHFGHGERTAYHALRRAEHIGLDRQRCLELHYAALLHDVGLLTLPRHLLDALTPPASNDFALLQSHPREGAVLLVAVSFLCEAARIIAHHHERGDGAWYPYGLRGVCIPVETRILALADAFDTLASRSTSWHTARRTLLASGGSQFDPELCAAFCDLLDDPATHRRSGNSAPFSPCITQGAEASCPATATLRML